MELDKIKNTWEKVSEIDAKPSDEQILNLLKSSNKSIWSGIVIKEKIGFIIGLIFCIFFCLLIPEFGGDFHGFLELFVYVVLMTIWQLFKWRYIKKIDIMNSDILSISKYVNKYRDFCIYEAVMVIIWIILLFVLLIMTPPSNFTIFKYFLVGVIFLALGVLTFFTTRYRYKTTIGKIKRNLEEMRAFENEE
jgi:hypothetical protein